MKRLVAYGAALGVWAAPAAHAQSVYQWVDESGQTHYTNTPEEIPKNRRSESVMVMDEVSAPTPPRSNNPRPPGRPPPPPSQGGSAEHGIVVEMPEDGPPPSPYDRPQEGESERREDEAREAEVRAQWQQAFRGANERVARAKVEERQAQESAESMGDSVVVTDSHGRAHLIQARRDAEDRLARAQLEVRAAQDALDALEREASRHAIPREWRR